MTMVLALGVAALALLVWVGRKPARLSQGARLASALFAALAAVAAVVSALRGGWIPSLILVGLSAYLDQRARAARPHGARQSQPAMTVEQARTILGVSELATSAEIAAAYRRRMKDAHPDQGGSDRLAAELNAARYRLTVITHPLFGRAIRR